MDREQLEQHLRVQFPFSDIRAPECYAILYDADHHCCRVCVYAPACQHEQPTFPICRLPVDVPVSARMYGLLSFLITRWWSWRRIVAAVRRRYPHSKFHGVWFRSLRRAVRQCVQVTKTWRLYRLDPP